jgi:hypothetical protein
LTASSRSQARRRPARQKNLLKNLGADEETINLLLRGTGELRRLYDEAGKFPGITAEDVAATKEWTEASAKLYIQLERVGTVIATYVTPAVRGLYDAATTLLRTNWEKSTEEEFLGLKAGLDKYLAYVKDHGPDILQSFKQGFNAVFDWLREQFNNIWMKLFGHKIFESALGGAAPTGLGTAPTAPTDTRNWWQRHAPKFLGGREAPILPPAPGRAGTYRPIYNLSDADTSNEVVNTVAGEAVASNQRSVDAVVNNMMNRLGTRAYGPSGNLREVARAPGQYTGYRQATEKEAAFIRERIGAVASGRVPDITGGSNEYRMSSYRGRWFMRHAEAADIGGNRFARNPSVPPGSYAPYDSPLLQKITSHAARLRLMRRSEQNIQKHAGIMHNAHVAMLQDSHATHDHSQHSSAVNVGNVNIHTSATDARGIAADMRAAMRRELLANEANYGLA